MEKNGLNKRRLGTLYEKKAGAYLESIGMRILQYSYRVRQGEIDIVAMDRETVVFCEVKYRKNGSFGGPLAAVGAVKQRRICAAALHYIAANGMTDCYCRFDVVGFESEKIVYIKDAFRGGGL